MAWIFGTSRYCFKHRISFNLECSVSSLFNHILKCRLLLFFFLDCIGKLDMHPKSSCIRLKEL